MPKVSIIIACYKLAHYLDECIQSVLNQSYKNIEIIVVNDGSPDNTNEIVAKYPSVILIEKENGGCASARNAGIKIATGEYIMSLDADDKLMPDGVKHHVDIIEPNSIMQCSLMEFGASYNTWPPIIGTNLKRILQANSIYVNALFPKVAWEKVGGYDESATIRLGYEDWEFWIRVLAAGYTVKTSSDLALRYRIHEKSMTRTTVKEKGEMLYDYIYNKHKKLYDEYGVSIIRFKN